MNGLAAALDELVPEVLELTGTPGLSVAVDCAGERLERGYGWVDVAARRPIDTGTRFPAGSMTKLYDAFTAHHRYDEWTATLARLATEAGLNGRRLLDVACGTGKSFLPFLDRGYTVSACDLSPAMVARARAKAAGRAHVDVHDMRSLPRLGAFDLVCCLDDAVNYLHDAGQLRAALAAMAANLAPGGVLVFDANTLRTYRTFFASLTVVQAEGEVLVWDGSTPGDLPAGGLARAQLDVLRAGDDGTWSRLRSEHAQRHHDGATVRDALAAAGLQPAIVRGMHLDGSLTEDVDEQANTKAIYVATHAHSPGTGEPVSERPAASARRVSSSA